MGSWHSKKSIERQEKLVVSQGMRPLNVAGAGMVAKESNITARVLTLLLSKNSWDTHKCVICPSHGDSAHCMQSPQINPNCRYIWHQQPCSVHIQFPANEPSARISAARSEELVQCDTRRPEDSTICFCEDVHEPGLNLLPAFNGHLQALNIVGNLITDRRVCIFSKG